MMFAPLERRWRHVAVTDRHTAVDFAHILKDLSDTHFPAAKRIVLMEDKLNTHKTSVTLQKHSPQPKLVASSKAVRRWHYTPRKHGSWLNMAEAELSVLSGQCLDRRIPDTLNLIEEVAAWEHTRNRKHVRADWQFTTADARGKLKRLPPRYERLGVLAFERWPIRQHQKQRLLLNLALHYLTAGRVAYKTPWKSVKLRCGIVWTALQLSNSGQTKETNTGKSFNDK